MLARNIDEEELPTTVKEGVSVERQGTGYGWYHDPDSYQPYADEVVMAREEADQNGAHPCPRCFPGSNYGSRFDVIEMPDGTTRYFQRDPEEGDRLLSTVSTVNTRLGAGSTVVEKKVRGIHSWPTIITSTSVR